MSLNLVSNLACFRTRVSFARFPRTRLVASMTLIAAFLGNAASYADYEQGVNAAFDGDYATA